MLNKINCTAKKYNINACKTKTKIKVEISVDSYMIEQVNNFCYLGQTITNDMRCKIEIRRSTRMAKIVFNKKKQILFSNKIIIEFRKRILKTYVWLMVLYKMETWTYNKN